MPDALGSYTAALYSDAGGLTQFGAFTETLPPGSRSSFKHWHEIEDEFILVIAGTVTLHEGDTVTQMEVGDAACFQVCAAIGHYLENANDTDMTYLVVGTRSPHDVVTYPDHNHSQIFDRRTKVRTHQKLDASRLIRPKGNSQQKSRTRRVRLNYCQIQQINYLIFPSLYSTCLRTTGSYLLTTIFSVIVRAFFLVT
ncbi:MAG: putative cupin superfamily protein [Yoonia sp.]|jgi:uncharacterized cupin superfamily protein